MNLPAPALLDVWLGLWVVQAAWCAWNIGHFLARLRHQREDRLRPREPAPRAALIVPVKGCGPELAEHVRALLNQDYPDYRLLLVVESETDPAHAALADYLGRFSRRAGLREARLLVAGLAERGGQKVHNQLRGLAELEPEDACVAFADADAVPGAGWLSAMVAAALKKRHSSSTGYRWMVPADDRWSTALACVLNAQVATMLGRPRFDQAWGGSMAILRPVLEESRLAELWQGALSDDYQFTRAVHSTGRRVYFNAVALTRSPVRFTWKSLWEFGRRQYRITRVYAPLAWLGGLGVLLFYLGGWAVAVFALTGGHAWAGWAMGAVMLCDVWRGWRRSAAAGVIFEDQPAGVSWKIRLLECLLTPLWVLFHAGVILSTMVGRRLTWAGIRYDMRAPQDVVILGRDAQAPGG